MTANAVEPFVLMDRVRLRPAPEPSEHESYDHDRQLWIDRSTGQAVVVQLQGGLVGSKFGETTLTESREGVDQSEVTSIEASRFGETTMTKSHEGQDQGESVLASRFGESTESATKEGVDVSEMASVRLDAPHTHL